MANDTTNLRRATKERWLRENPTHHEWLRQRAPSTLYSWLKDPMALDMIRELRAAGIYAPQTVAVDICAAMRRVACTFEPNSPLPSQRAAAEIEVILARDGVDRAQVLEQLAS